MFLLTKHSNRKSRVICYLITKDNTKHAARANSKLKKIEKTWYLVRDVWGHVWASMSGKCSRVSYMPTYTIAKVASHRIVTLVALAYAVRSPTWNYPAAILTHFFSLSLSLSVCVPSSPFYFSSLTRTPRGNKREKLHCPRPVFLRIFLIRPKNLDSFYYCT